MISAERFERLRQSSPELQNHLRTLQRVYKRSRDGVVTQHAGSFMGCDSITTIYQLADEQRWVASRVVGAEIFEITRVGATEPTRVLRFTNGRLKREIRLNPSSMIDGITAFGPWPGLHEIHDRALARQPLSEAHREAFELRGTMVFERDPTLVGDYERLCKCTKVDSGVIRRAIAEDCRSLPELQSRFGCGTVCGGCIPLIHELIARPAWQFVTIHEEVRHSANLRSFRFAPVHGPLATHTPGQHATFQARIGDHWVERPYMLAAAGDATEECHIVVEQHEGGVFTVVRASSCTRWSALRTTPDTSSPACLAPLARALDPSSTLQPELAACPVCGMDSCAQSSTNG